MFWISGGQHIAKVCRQLLFKAWYGLVIFNIIYWRGIQNFVLFWLLKLVFVWCSTITKTPAAAWLILLGQLAQQLKLHRLVVRWHMTHDRWQLTQNYYYFLLFFGITDTFSTHPEIQFLLYMWFFLIDFPPLNKLWICSVSFVYLN